jgi:hypothetical protein
VASDHVVHLNLWRSVISSFHWVARLSTQPNISLLLNGLMIVPIVTSLLLVLLVLPETLSKTSQARALRTVTTGVSHLENGHKSKRQVLRRRIANLTEISRRSFVEPIWIVRFLRFPAVLLTVYYASITFGTLYVLNISIQLTFERRPYSFPAMKVGLLYLPASLGYLASSLSAGHWMDHIMLREARKAERYDPTGQPFVRPEDRMRENAWLGAICYPLALIVYGWTVEKGVHWIVPVSCHQELEGRKPSHPCPHQMIALFFFGFGSMILLSLTITMLTEFTAGMHTGGVAVSAYLLNTGFTWSKSC